MLKRHKVGSGPTLNSEGMFLSDVLGSDVTIRLKFVQSMEPCRKWLNTFLSASTTKVQSSICK